MPKWIGQKGQYVTNMAPFTIVKGAMVTNEDINEGSKRKWYSQWISEWHEKGVEL